MTITITQDHSDSDSCELGGRSTRPNSLHQYAEQGDIFELGTLLASSLFEVDYLDANGKAPLHYAVEKGHAHCCKALLRSNADPLLLSREGKSSLKYAAENYHAETFQVSLTLTNQWLTASSAASRRHSG